MEKPFCKLSLYATPEILKSYGFQEVSKEDYEDNFVILNYDYVLDLGHSRRGQHYYVLVKLNNRSVSLYASEPDGNGCEISVPEKLLKLFTDRVIIC